jgi:branched-chain amino acid transport system substrate-binding protein
VLRLDPRTRRMTDRIQIVSRPGFESPYPVAIEVGAGSVWVLNANTQTVTRIDPRARGITATIPIGVERGPLRLAAGDGAAWVANDDGTLSRIDAATNAVRTFAVAPGLRDVGVVPGGIWVTAGPGSSGRASADIVTGSRASTRAIGTATCSPIYYGAGRRPDVLVASSLPLQGQIRGFGSQMAAAIKLILRQNHFRAGRYAVGYQSCDDAIVNTAPGEETRCANNATAYANAPSLVGVVGPFLSGCAAQQLSILNQARQGPLAMVSPANTYVGLTKGGPGSMPGEPRRYFPTGTRSYARIIATDDFQAAANAMLAKQFGARNVFVLDDDEPYGIALASFFSTAGQRLGLKSAGHVSWDGVRSRKSLARQIRRSGADSLFLAGYIHRFGGRLLRDLRATLGPNVRMFAPDGFLDAAPRVAGASAERLTVSVAGIPVAALPERGKAFASQFERAVGTSPETFTVYAAQATQVLLDAIARSDGTRRSVTAELFKTRVRNGILGDFAITPTGDTTKSAITIYRIQDGKQRFLRVLTPPASLVARTA